MFIKNVFSISYKNPKNFSWCYLNRADLFWNTPGGFWGAALKNTCGCIIIITRQSIILKGFIFCSACVNGEVCKFYEYFFLFLFPQFVGFGWGLVDFSPTLTFPAPLAGCPHDWPVASLSPCRHRTWIIATFVMWATSSYFQQKNLTKTWYAVLCFLKFFFGDILRGGVNFRA